MSGPKTSHYTLTPEQRRILEEQRKITLEREILARRQGDIRSAVSDAEQIIEKLEPFFAESGADLASLTRVKALHKSALDILSQAASVTDAAGSSMIKELNRGLREITLKLTSAAKAAKTEYTSAEKAFRAEHAEHIDAGFDLSFDTVGDATAIEKNPFAKKILSALSSLSELPVTDTQIAQMNAIYAKFAEIEDPHFMKNFYAMTVSPFVKECRAYHEAYAVCGEEYERKLYIYKSNAAKTGITPEDVPFSADAVAILDAKIAETEELIRQHDEQSYISRCVDEAMREMGYSVAGDREVVRRNGKRFRNELYLFDEGTAVNVTYSDDGQITMELGGIGMENRIPTDAESASLESDMRTFCDDYYEIEQLLLKKGIVTKRISVLPPQAQYAQIINVSDYNLNTEVSEYKAGSTKKSASETKRKKAGE